jgi:thioredoxin-related protein
MMKSLLQFICLIFCFNLLETLSSDELSTSDALLTIFSSDNEAKFQILTNNIECIDCLRTEAGIVSSKQNLTLRFDTFRPSYSIYIINSQTNEQHCHKYDINPIEFNINATYLMHIFTRDVNLKFFNF